MHHVLQSYIPTALIVIISWFSFWLDISAVLGEVSLCITTLLTLAMQAQAAEMSLPQGKIMIFYYILWLISVLFLQSHMRRLSMYGWECVWDSCL